MLARNLQAAIELLLDLIRGDSPGLKIEHDVGKEIMQRRGEFDVRG